MFHSFQLMFMLILIMSIIMQISSSSWFSIWLGMEMNLLSFISFMSISENQIFNESPMKYFLIQAFGSIILLFSWLMKYFSFPSMTFINQTSNAILFLSLTLKLGAAPMHFWFPAMLNNMTWFSSFLLMTLQKLGPLIVLMYLNHMMMFLSLSVLLNTFIGSIGGFNQTNLQKMFAYSSISHLGWLMISLIINEQTFIMYYIFYFMMMMTFCMLFSLNMTNNISQFFLYKESFFMEKYIIILNFLSLGGLPPFSGFFMKWMILNELIYMKMYYMSLFIIFMSMINLFYYLRISYSYITFSNTNMNMFILFKKNNKYILFIIFLKTSILVFIPLSLWLLYFFKL